MKPLCMIGLVVVTCSPLAADPPWIGFQTEPMPAESSLDLTAANTDAPPTDDPFDKGSWTFQTYGSTTFGDDDKGFLHSAHVGFGYYFRDNLSINVEGVGGTVDAKKDDDGGFGGLDVLFRWHFYRNSDFSIFLDAGAGLQEATTNFPSDSHHNFRPQGGVGATWRITHDLLLIGGAKYLHVSNANTSDINAGLDAMEVYLGVLMPF